MQGELELPPGFRFHPTDDELVTHYLCRKCAAQSIGVPIIKEIDLYKFDPWQLPGTSFSSTAFLNFFFFIFYLFIFLLSPDSCGSFKLLWILFLFLNLFCDSVLQGNTAFFLFKFYFSKAFDNI